MKGVPGLSRCLLWALVAILFDFIFLFLNGTKFFHWEESASRDSYLGFSTSRCLYGPGKDRLISEQQLLLIIWGHSMLL